jgi:hypothetical protein
VIALGNGQKRRTDIGIAAPIAFRRWWRKEQGQCCVQSDGPGEGQQIEDCEGQSVVSVYDLAWKT